MDNKCSKPNIPDEVTVYSEKKTMRKKIKEYEIWDELEVGTQIALIRDRNNKHDRNAVAVALADDYDSDPDDFDFDFILGYVPRTDNAELAAMIDAGYTAFVMRSSNPTL